MKNLLETLGKKEIRLTQEIEHLFSIDCSCFNELYDLGFGS